MWLKVVAILSAAAILAVVLYSASRDGAIARVEVQRNTSSDSHNETGTEAGKTGTGAIRRAEELRRSANPGSTTIEERNRTVGAHPSPQEAHRAFLKATTDAYPLQSMKDRIPRRTAKSNAELSSEAEAELKELETAAAGRFNRSWALKDVHDEAVKKFSNTEGAGIRRIPIFSKEMIDSLKRSDEVPLQPEIVGTTVAEPAATTAKIEDALKTLHRAGIGDFASPQDLGYVTDDGKQAAGFIAHRFTKTPPADPRLRLKRIDLVGLLMHPKPVVYVSDKLPRMEELKEAPTRPLDDFEAKSIEAIRKGESLVIREVDSGLRMVGAIRAAKQCTGCHDCQRGELLGAFSYRFEQP